MPTQINGVPAHVLLIHLVVVLVPLAALLLIAQAWSPAVRRWAGALGPLTAFAALVLVPVTASAGEWLQGALRRNGVRSPLIDKHADLGGQLLPWVAGMFLLSVAVWLLGRGEEARRAIVLPPTQGSARVQLLVAVLATVVAVGSLVQVFRVGDSGAKAVWSGTVVTS
jgi:hypothetical protein